MLPIRCRMVFNDSPNAGVCAQVGREDAAVHDFYSIGAAATSSPTKEPNRLGFRVA